MTKKEIANKISTELDLPQTIVLNAVRRTFESIITTLEAEGRIELRDFAVFEVVTRKARTGRNPRTGEVVAVPPRTTVKFTPGKEMTKTVREAMAWKVEESVSEETDFDILVATKVDITK